MSAMAILRLLTILREETDDTHRMSGKELAGRLNERFGIRLNRRTLKTHLDELTAAGYPLNSTVRERVLPDGTIERTHTDWYIDPVFEVSEQRLLQDLLQGMTALPQSQRETLQGKLRQLSTPTFRETTEADCLRFLHRPVAQQLLYTVDTLCAAIRSGVMVTFQYCSCELGEDGRPELVPKKTSEGNVREYFVSPYEIVVSQGRYYLLGCKEPYSNISHYRLDRMKDICLLEGLSRRPIETTDGMPSAAHVADQLYMYSGEPVTCRFRIDRGLLCDVLDWFGSDIGIEPEEETLVITVSVHPTAMEHWAMQYGRSVTVLEPESLRQSIAEAAAEMAERYKEE